MIKRTLLAAVAASSLFAAPAIARPMTATDMHMMHRLGTPEVSPDGRWAVFTMSDTDLAANKRNNTLYLLDLKAKGASPQPVAGAQKGHDAVFAGDGSIWFLMDAAGQDQLFRMVPGQAPVQVSNLKGDIGGFKLAPSGDRLVIWADRDLRCADFTCAGLPKKAETGSGRTYDQLFVRHWDTWAEPGVRSRLFGFQVAGGQVAGTGAPLTGMLIGDTPSKPFGGGEEIAFSPDGRTVYFALREAGRIEPSSTNLDIFSVPSDGSARPTNLTADNDATDNLPAVSPDGRTLAYFAMARPGYEADRQVIMLRDLATGQTRALDHFELSAGGLNWTRDGRHLLVETGQTLDNPIWLVDVDPQSKAASRLTGPGSAHNPRPLPDGSVLFTMNSIQAPDDLYVVKQPMRVTQLTNVNADLLKQLDPVKVERFNFVGANNDRVFGIKVKPAAVKQVCTPAEGCHTPRLPVAFVVHGGPQGSFGDGWSYRWNPRLFTSPGYAVVSVDFHGSTGYGQAFTDSIRNNWGGWPLEDLQRGLDYALKQDIMLDGDRACALGASYGGYMMNWIEGQWPDRFKCLVQHDGVFDARAMAYETEELWFDEWEHGGKAYYEDPAAFEKWNPVNYVQNWKTPMLVITGEKDFRIPYTQGIAAFTALQRKGVPSKLLVFPDENHWVLKPKNSIQWYDEVFKWMDRWLSDPIAVRAR